MIDTKTFAEWIAMDPKLGEHAGVFRERYGMMADQHMDIHTVNMRLAGIGIGYQSTGSAVAEEPVKPEDEFLGDELEAEEQKVAADDAEIERQLLAEEAAAKAAASTPATAKKK